MTNKSKKEKYLFLISNQYKKTSILLLLTGLIQSCALFMPDTDFGWAKYSVSKSEVSGETLHSLSRGAIKSDTGMYVTLHKNSSTEIAVMRVYTYPAHAYSSGESLSISIDGKVKKYKGNLVSSLLESDGYGHLYSYQSYNITRAELQEMVSGKKVFFRVDFLDRFTEGDFSFTERKDAEYVKGNIYAKEGFPEFIAKAWN